MNRHERQELDRYITGNYGEDQFRGMEAGMEAGMEEGMTREEALIALRASFRLAQEDGGPCELPQYRMADILAALSPCACEGREPIAVLHGYAVAGASLGVGETERESVHLAVQERLIVHNFEDMPICLEGEQAYVIILPAEDTR